MSSIGKDVEDLVGKQEDEGIESPGEQKVESQEENEVGKAAEQEAEALVEEPKINEEAKPAKSYKKVIKGSIIALCTLLVLYGGMTANFTKHFYFGSEINCINVSGKTVTAAEVLMDSELQNYMLTLKMREGESEQIKATEVGLRYTSYDEFKKLKDSQSPFNWILACFSAKDSKMKVGVSYDEKLLKDRIDNLSCFDSSKIIEPKNPSFQYVDNHYVIVDEILGNKVDKNILYSYVADALGKAEAEIDLESLNCYLKPTYDSKSQKVIEIKNTLNKYVSSKITYTFGSTNEILDGTTINKWLTVDENLEIVVDERKVKDYIDMLSDTYNTIGKTRSFVASTGETVEVGGGDFGRSINKAKEAESLISAIKEGKRIIKEPAYSQTVFAQGSSDIADTYVEINLTKQHIWFYKNGSLIVDGDIVTGNVKAGNVTRKGVFSLKYKAKNVVLRGRGYAAPVTFWMPFDKGIGMHDASWRNVFGGNIYKTSGSHGCVNCPYNVAKAIYDNIELGTPVICY